MADDGAGGAGARLSTAWRGALAAATGSVELVVDSRPPAPCMYWAFGVGLAAAIAGRVYEGRRDLHAVASLGVAVGFITQRSSPERSRRWASAHTPSPPPRPGWRPWVPGGSAAYLLRERLGCGSKVNSDAPREWLLGDGSGSCGGGGAALTGGETVWVARDPGSGPLPAGAALVD